MRASTSKPFNLDFTLHNNPTLLTIYDSESFGSTVGFCMLPPVRSIHPSHQIVFATDESGFPHNTIQYMLVWPGMVHLSCTDGTGPDGPVGLLCFLACCIPLVLLLLLVRATLFSYPYTPHSLGAGFGAREAGPRRKRGTAAAGI